jgi:hypothetical protein
MARHAEFQASQERQSGRACSLADLPIENHFAVTFNGEESVLLAPFRVSDSRVDFQRIYEPVHFINLDF